MPKMIWWRIVVPNIALVLSLIVSGCNMMQTLKDDKIDYKSAGNLPPLEIPPDLVAPETDERYTIPGQAQGSTTFSSYNSERGGRSKELSLLPMPEEEGVHIKRAGTQRWLVVPQAPEVVWPIVKGFWQELGFLIKLETPETGILETDWAEDRAKIPQGFVRNILSTFLDSIYSTAERDKFRTRLERGESGTTEIYISHRGMDEVIESGITRSTVWQPRPADPDLEAEMLSRLMLRFGVNKEQARLELATSNNVAQERAYIDPNQADTLIINEAFDRSWRRVGLALDRVGFTVEDRNRLDGIYFVRYINPDIDSHKSEDDDGVLSDIMFWRNKDSSDEKAVKYRIQIRETGTSNSQVTVLNNENDMSVDSSTASRILELLHEQLK